MNPAKTSSEETSTSLLPRSSKVKALLKLDQNKENNQDETSTELASANEKTTSKKSAKEVIVNNLAEDSELNFKHQLEERIENCDRDYLKVDKTKGSQNKDAQKYVMAIAI